MTRVVGLTGGIGSGKSTVSRLLSALGAVVIDSDAIVHELQAPRTPLLARIAESFGSEMIRPDGSLDRARLGQLVFGDVEERARLNALVHPVVGRETQRRLEAARAAGAALVVLDIPLLLEGRTAPASEARSERRQRTPSDSASEVIVVYSPEAAQIERQVLRDGVSREHALARIRSQLSIEEKRKLADYVIDNSGTLEATERQVRELYAKLVEA